MNWTITKWKLEGSDKYNPISIEVVGQISGPDKYAVRQGGNVLSKQGKWEYEPSPSNRDEEFMKRCRFDSFEEASATVKQFVI